MVVGSKGAEDVAALGTGLHDCAGPASLQRGKSDFVVELPSNRVSGSFSPVLL